MQEDTLGKEAKSENVAPFLMVELHVGLVYYVIL